MEVRNMNWKEEYKKLFGIAIIFLVAYFLPVEKERFTHAVHESLALAKFPHALQDRLVVRQRARQQRRHGGL